MSFAECGIVVEFKGDGAEEKAFVVSCSNTEYQLPVGKEVVAVDPQYFRPTEVDLLIWDPTKSNTKLGWKPKYDLPMLVNEMMASDLALFKKDQYLAKGGHSVKNYNE